jgi:hypothetical protein
VIIGEEGIMVVVVFGVKKSEGAKKGLNRDFVSEIRSG